MLDNELRALVSAEPSAEFTARVREAVRHDRTPSTRGLHGALALAACAVVALAISSFVADPADVARGTSLAAIRVGQTDVPLREAISDMSSQQTAVAESISRPAPGRQQRFPIQLDPVEMRALQALFAHPPTAFIELPKTPDDGIVIPAVTVEPLQFASLSEGASQ